MAEIQQQFKCDHNNKSLQNELLYNWIGIVLLSRKKKKNNNTKRIETSRN